MCAKQHEPQQDLIVKDDIEEGTVDVDATVVIQEAQIPELVHEVSHP